MNEFKIRASAASKINGVKALGETGKTYCKQWLKEFRYKRRKDIKSKYIEKGNQCEEDGFTLLCTELNLGMVYKNKESFEDEYFTGTPDLVLDKVYDNKCSWDLDTFPMFEIEIPNKDYEDQLQVYMHLTGKKKSVLVYTLIDAPEYMVEAAVKWLTAPEEIYKCICNMVYTEDYFNTLTERFCPLATSDYFVEIPEADRIKTFNIDYDPEVIKKLITRVYECRTYINSLINK